MVSNQVIQDSIEDVQAIAKVKMCVLNQKGKVVASTLNSEELPWDAQKTFLASQAESQTVQGYQFFKVFEEDKTVFVLIVEGDGQDAYTIGQLVARQIQALLLAYKKSIDMEAELRYLLLNKIHAEDIKRYSGSMHIERGTRRAVFLIATKKQKVREVMKIVRNLFADSLGSRLALIDDGVVALLKELKNDETDKDLEKTAFMLVDMLNAEVMVHVRVSYGCIVRNLEEVSDSFQEARIALDVGKIFYSNKRVLPYSALGIGRLIYQMPKSLCEEFLKEIFAEESKDVLNRDILDLVYKFFGNNLNLSETARQLYMHRNTLVYRLEKIQKFTGLDIRNFDDALVLKIALMVMDYLEYLEEK